jgi:hypothetical protein
MAAFTRTPRFQGLRDAMVAGRPLPAVELYLLDGHYYIRDGHHRAAAARQLGAREVDAEVTEFLPVEPPAAAWHRAHGAFERDTGLAGLHLRRAEGYEALRRQIAEHGWYLGERGRAPGSFRSAAAAWAREVYRPVLAALEFRGLPARAPDLTAAELYLAVCEHKWYRSERRRRDVGFAAATADYARARRHPRLARVRDWLACRGGTLARAVSCPPAGLLLIG